MKLHYLGASFFLLACAAPSFAQNDATPEQIEFFEKRIRPLFVQHCYRCHSQEAKKLGGKLYLDSREGVRAGGRSGPVLVPGKPKESLLMEVVRSDDKDVRMPQGGKLSAPEIADLETWIAMGAPDPRKGKAIPAVKRNEIDIEAGKKFWSFQPIRSSRADRQECRLGEESIDRFILRRKRRDSSRLARRSPHADSPRDRLMTGLPRRNRRVPQGRCRTRSPGSSIGCSRRRRMASSRARRWLDVVRYADAGTIPVPIPQMYLYRNWVIDAFNRDMPYDQFVREQLAGDLLSTKSEDRSKNSLRPAISARAPLQLLRRRALSLAPDHRGYD